MSDEPFFGGVPMAIVPDNLKSAVTRGDRNEPVINEDFSAFAEHYGCAVYPARVRHPKDKALVENAVKLMYRSVYVDIEGLVFHDTDSLNAAIRESLKRFNGRRQSGRDESRQELFDRTERDYLQPLPSARFQAKERRSYTVLKNSYVTLFKHHYSVPKEYIGKRVGIVYDADTPEIFHGLKLITTHDRDNTPYAYSPKAFRSCRGIMSLEKKYGLDRLVAACACATEKRAYGYQEVLAVLQAGDDAEYLGGEGESGVTAPTIQRHKNIRGREYFSNNDKSNEENNREQWKQTARLHPSCRKKTRTVYHST